MSSFPSSSSTRFSQHLTLQSRLCLKYRLLGSCDFTIMASVICYTTPSILSDRHSEPVAFDEVRPLSLKQPEPREILMNECDDESSNDELRDDESAGDE